LLDRGADVIAFALAHFLAGILIGARFRFFALFPAFAVVGVESLVGAFYFGLAEWYVILLVGLVAIQVGYALASRVRPIRRPAEMPPFQPSTPK
jgi:hypothetical protein